MLMSCHTALYHDLFSSPTRSLLSTPQQHIAPRASNLFCKQHVLVHTAPQPYSQHAAQSSMSCPILRSSSQSLQYHLPLGGSSRPTHS